MRLKVKQTRPTCLNDAVRVAVELEAFYRAEKTQHGYVSATSAEKSSYSEEMAEMKKTMAKMQSMLENLSREKSRGESPEKPVFKRQNSYQNRQFGGRQDRKYASDKDRLSGKRVKKCFRCGSEKHLISNCPEPKSTGFDKKQNEHDRKKSNLSKLASAGLYTTARIDGEIVDCLVDTGASLSLISKELWDVLRQQHVLQPFKSPIVSASGDELNIEGMTEVCFQFGDVLCPMQVVIAKLDVDAILGIDFMEKHGVSVDVSKLSIQIKNTQIELRRHGKIGCYRVVLADKVDVPPRSEVITKGQVKDQAFKRMDVGLVECSERFLECGKGMVARTLVQANELIPIRLANFSQETQTFYPGTSVATLTSVNTVDVSDTKSSSKQTLPAHLHQLYEDATEGMHNENKKQIRKLLLKYAHIFSKTDEDLGRTGIIKHQIPTGDARPIKQRFRRIPVHMQEEVDSQLDKMLEDGIIQPSTSPWSSGIVLVKKKDGTQRFCIDYRRVNDVTTKDAYPLPRIDESLDQLTGAKWFSCLDLSSGYWQVEVEESDKAKTAFSTRRGLFEFNVMPFGLCNAPATFERLMDSVLAGLNWQICLVYLDDIIVVGKTFEGMIENLDTIFQRFEIAGLKLKPRKCQLFKKEVEFLGHVVSEQGVSTDPRKVECVRNWPTPKTVTEVRSFLGLCSYYRRFIRDYSKVAKPLFRLTEKHTSFKWTTECEKTFNFLKDQLSTAPILVHPDFSEPFILDTDASQDAIGSVLSQKVDGVEKVVAYASRTLTKAEKKYCVTRKEMLALVFFVKYFRHYLYGRKFKIRTDHGSLRWLMKFKEPEGQVARWLEVLAPFQMEIEHRRGKLHGNADGLSRIPCRQCGMTDKDKLQGELTPGPSLAQGLANLNNASGESELTLLQKDDREITLVRGWVDQKSKPPFKEIKEMSYVAKSLWNQFERLEIQNDMLVRKWDDFDTKRISYQVIVPSSQRRTILKHAHDIKASGHLGIRKTLAKIRQNFYWPGLQRDVRMYVSGCEACMKRKGPLKSKQAPMKIVRSGYPMERVAIDILGELPQTDNGNKYIVVVADYFTKWTECFPMRNMEAATVAKILVEEVFTRFGVPAKIHSDQGRQFESKLFSEMCRLLGIEKTRTTPYHPQSDGMVERFNRTLTAMLSAYVNENHSNWDENIPYVMMAYRSSEHETTGMSPNMLMLGREVATPLDLIFELPRGVKKIPENDWAWKLQEMLESAHSFVRDTTGKSMQRQKSIHDKKTSYETFQTDDLVYVYFPIKKVGTSSKFTSFWRGPFKILAKLSDVLYKVDCGRNQTPQVIHCDRIRKCRKQNLLGESTESQESHTLEEQDNASICDLPNELTEEVERTDVRKRKPPVWSKDYVFSICSSHMAKTKITPRKPPQTICPGCRETVVEKYQEHLKSCEAYQKGRTPCNQCGKTFKRLGYLRKHQEQSHSKVVTTSSNSKELESDSEVSSSDTDMDSDSSASSEGESWNKDPEICLGETAETSSQKNGKGTAMQANEASVLQTDKAGEDILAGRVMRKPTKPSQPLAPKRKSPEPETESTSSAVPDKRLKVEKEVQTEILKSESATQCCESKEEKSVQVKFENTGTSRSSSSSSSFECGHCGIKYSDPVMFYIHQGCHTSGDPFRCNVCGEKKSDPLQFYAHLNRDHARNQ